MAAILKWSSYRPKKRLGVTITQPTLEVLPRLNLKHLKKTLTCCLMLSTHPQLTKAKVALPIISLATSSKIFITLLVAFTKKRKELMIYHTTETL